MSAASARRCRSNDAIADIFTASAHATSRAAAFIASINAIGDSACGRTPSNAAANSPPGAKNTHPGALSANVARRESPPQLLHL
jgi:hypothetical protein